MPDQGGRRGGKEESSIGDDVRMKDTTTADNNNATTNKEMDALKKSSIEDRLAAVVELIGNAVKQREPRLISSRLLRQTQGLRKDLDGRVVLKFVDAYMGRDSACSDVVRRVLVENGGNDREANGQDAVVAMEEEETETETDKKREEEEEGKNVTVEVEMYSYLLACLVLVDAKRWDGVLSVCDVAIGKASAYNVRTIDPLSARLYSYLCLAAERLGKLAHIRGLLLNLHRAAVLRHDTIGQETLLNLLLRNYLSCKLYNQAEALRAKAQPEVSKSTAQHCRLLYYHGRIQAVLLEYSDSKEALVQASRKAPHSAVGFRLQIAKWLVVVRLLLGEVPSRSELAPADLRSKMKPYFDLARAVGLGDVKKFHSVATTYEASFEADDIQHVVARLRANVIRSGVRRIAAAYSRISLQDVAHKLGLSSVSDAEYIVAKAIRDGGISAVLDHKEGTMTCSRQLDVYSTDEPVNAFHARIAFCLDVHNEAQKAIRHYPKSQKEWDGANAARERQEQELQAALEEEFDF